jgi:hypothetical protein
MKFCKDCAHQQDTPANRVRGYDNGTCSVAKLEMDVDLVTGAETPKPGARRRVSCEYQRSVPFPFDVFSRACGKRGRFFKQRCIMEGGGA